VKQAAALTYKATTALKQGKIEAAVRTLRTIAQNYPGTPQAVEAQKLLEGLPDGL
jgi:TolA-binding protein